MTQNSQNCKYCQQKALIVTPGKGVHAAGLTCPHCGRHNKWLRKNDPLVALAQAIVIEETESQINLFNLGEY